MNKKRIAVSVISIIMIFTTMLSGCGKNISSSTAANSESSDTPAVKQEINVPFTMDPKTLDISVAGETTANAVIYETQEGLVRLMNNKIEPAGATNWETSEDGLTWTFHLRDMKWSDGTKITAQDYEYEMKRFFDPAVAAGNAPIFYCIVGGEEFNTGNGGTADGVGVKALDEKTLQFKLKTPVPYFLQLCNFVNVMPLKKEVVDKGGAAYGTDPKEMLYSGPFVIDQWIKGSAIVLKKNPNYWDAENVKLDTVNMLIVPEQSTREQLFDSKQLDIIQDVKGEYAQKLKAAEKGGDVVLQSGYYPSVSYVAFNNRDKNKIFTNAKVRLAFSLAIDREGYINNVIKKDMPTYGFVPYGTNNGDTVFRDKVEEPLKAVKEQDPKKLLEEGLKELGMDPNKQIEVTFLQRNTNADQRVLGEFYQDQWQKKLGVKVKIDVASDSATFNTTIGKGEYQIAQTGWGADYNDPMTFLELFLTIQGDTRTNNSIFFSDAEYDRLIKAAAAEPDMNKRLELFKQAEKILVVDKAGLAPVSFSYKTNYSQKYVMGALFQACGPAFELKTAYIEK